MKYKGRKKPEKKEMGNKYIDRIQRKDNRLGQVPSILIAGSGERLAQPELCLVID